MGLTERMDALMGRVTGPVGEWADIVNPFRFSDDRREEAVKALVSFFATFTSEFGLMAATGALAAWAAKYSPELAVGVEQSGNWVEMAVLVAGSAITLSHGFMAGHP